MDSATGGKTWMRAMSGKHALSMHAEYYGGSTSLLWPVWGCYACSARILVVLGAHAPCAGLSWHFHHVPGRAADKVFGKKLAKSCSLRA